MYYVIRAKELNELLRAKYELTALKEVGFVDSSCLEYALDKKMEKEGRMDDLQVVIGEKMDCFITITDFMRSSAYLYEKYIEENEKLCN